MKAGKKSRKTVATETRQSADGASPNHWREGRNRVEKSALVRETLLWAAAEVVGEVGYAAASITRITQKAGVAPGPFYNSFAPRQEILAPLLLDSGANMRQHIREDALCSHGLATLAHRGFFVFLRFFLPDSNFF